MSTCKGTNGDSWEIYKSGDDWRWKRTARNGDRVGASTEGYKSKAHCIENAKRNGMDCDPV